MNKQVRRKTHN